MGQVTPAYWKEFALEIDQPEADAIFLSCGGIRSLEVVEEIEQAAGKPVITSNQAQFWSCLRRAGIKDELSGFGQIFKHPGKSPEEDPLSAWGWRIIGLVVCRCSVPAEG